MTGTWKSQAADFGSITVKGTVSGSTLRSAGNINNLTLGASRSSHLSSSPK